MSVLFGLCDTSNPYSAQSIRMRNTLISYESYRHYKEAIIEKLYIYQQSLSEEINLEGPFVFKNIMRIYNGYSNCNKITYHNSYGRRRLKRYARKHGISRGTIVVCAVKVLAKSEGSTIGNIGIENLTVKLRILTSDQSHFDSENLVILKN